MIASSIQRRRIGAVCTVLLAAQLVACGGGGGDTPSASTPPPVNNNPPTNPPTNPQPPSTPAPTTSKVTLTGTVTDAPIANAVVTAKVGTQTFTATADANGNYSLPIEIDDSAAGEFVTLTARGVGDQSYVEFTSLAGSFQALLDAAGDDETLSNSENFATQITNVSTAAAVFLQQANNGNPITSDTALQTLSGQINAQDVLDLAAAIKLVVDHPADYSMPAGQTSILELASDPSARQLFVNDVYQQDPNAFAAAQLAIASDPAMAQPVNPAGLESITTALMSTDAGFTFNYTGRILHFDFNPDGTGFAQSENFDQPFTWALNGSTINVTYSQPQGQESFDTVYCPDTDRVQQVKTEHTDTSANVTFLNRRTVAITSTTHITYVDCSTLQPRVTTETVARTVLSPEDLLPITVEELAGNTQTLYVYDAAQGRVTADVAELRANGTGTTRVLGLTFTWTVDEETGRLVQVAFADGTFAEYGSFRDVDDVVSDIYWEVRTPNNGPVYTGAGASAFVDPEYAVEFSLDDVPGSYFQFGIGDETTNDARLKGFRLRFDADFTGAEENDLRDNQTLDAVFDQNGAPLTDDEQTDPSKGFRWTLDDGAVVVRRTFDISTQTYACEFGTPDCILYDERRIVPLVAVPMGANTRLYWLEARRQDRLEVTASTRTTRLIRFYDKPTEQTSQGVQKTTRAGTSAPSKQRELLRGPQLH